jgi:hypothetical protein
MIRPTPPRPPAPAPHFDLRASLVREISRPRLPSDFVIRVSFGLRPSDFGFQGRRRLEPESRIRIKIRIRKGKNLPTPHYPRTTRQPVSTPVNIGPKSLSNRQPLDFNVKDRGADEKICEFPREFTLSINNNPSGKSSGSVSKPSDPVGGKNPKGILSSSPRPARDSSELRGTSYLGSHPHVHPNPVGIAPSSPAPKARQP